MPKDGPGDDKSHPPIYPTASIPADH